MESEFTLFEVKTAEDAIPRDRITGLTKTDVSRLLYEAAALGSGKGDSPTSDHVAESLETSVI
jgi:hypothetical protein